ncbi:MAG TPA: hypothetical protein PKA58_13295 [Polyangium sp.]|jgi:hypothetical protein|nr:hypothetical protein [Polyangium sp.]
MRQGKGETTTSKLISDKAAYRLVGWVAVFPRFGIPGSLLD